MSFRNPLCRFGFIFLLQEINKNGFYGIPEDDRAFQGSGSNFLWRSGDFLSSESHRNPIFLVDGIIELCINVQEILEFVVAVQSPNKKLISSVFIYGKPVKGTLMTFCF